MTAPIDKIVIPPLTKVVPPVLVTETRRGLVVSRETDKLLLSTVTLYAPVFWTVTAPIDRIVIPPETRELWVVFNTVTEVTVLRTDIVADVLETDTVCTVFNTEIVDEVFAIETTPPVLITVTVVWGLLTLTTKGLLTTPVGAVELRLPSTSLISW